MSDAVLAVSDQSQRKDSSPNHACVVCGQENTKGLRIMFTQSTEGSKAEWIPGTEWEGYPGVVHGGIVSTVLDEAMSKAVAGNGWEAYTAELRVRFREKVSSGERIMIRGHVISKQKRKILAEASIETESGEERAHAWGTFLEATPARP